MYFIVFFNNTSARMGDHARHAPPTLFHLLSRRWHAGWGQYAGTKIIAVTERSINYDILPRVGTTEMVLEGEGSRVLAGD